MVPSGTGLQGQGRGAPRATLDPKWLRSKGEGEGEGEGSGGVRCKWVVITEDTLPGPDGLHADLCPLVLLHVFLFPTTAA